MEARLPAGFRTETRRHRRLYFGLPQIGIPFEPIPSAILALTLFSAAYLSENFRGGIVGVDKGQWEAGFSMGMAYWRVFRRLTVPQALRIATPAVAAVSSPW